MTDAVFIGYDAREHEAAAVCAHSIRRFATKPLRIYLLEHRMLRRLGLFMRDWQISANGQFKDLVDGRPFSTEFSHSRFLVFELARRLGLRGACMFVDCDFLFRADVSGLLAEQRRHPGQIGVVPMDRAISTDTKMDGMVQARYPRKLWSAMFTFMPSKELADRFNPAVVNTADGRELHQFLGMPDDAFWPIPAHWHVVPSMEATDTRTAFALHYSEFSPWLNPERGADSPHAFSQWYEARQRVWRSAAETERFLLVDNLEQDLKTFGQA